MGAPYLRASASNAQRVSASAGVVKLMVASPVRSVMVTATCRMTDLHVTYVEIQHSIPWVSSFLDASAPHAMDLAYMLYPVSLLDLPVDIMWNLNNLQFRTVTVRHSS